MGTKGLSASEVSWVLSPWCKACGLGDRAQHFPKPELSAHSKSLLRTGKKIFIKDGQCSQPQRD